MYSLLIWFYDFFVYDEIYTEYRVKKFRWGILMRTIYTNEMKKLKRIFELYMIGYNLANDATTRSCREWKEIRWIVCKQYEN